MECTVIINGHSYDLPKKTMRIAERIEDVVKKDQLRICMHVLRRFLELKMQKRSSEVKILKNWIWVRSH